MAIIFNVNPNGTGFGTTSNGTDNNTHRENTINLDTYLDNDVKLPGICKQNPVWQTDSTSGFSYSVIGSHVFLSGTFNGVSGSSSGSTMATLGPNLAPSKIKYFSICLKSSASSTAAESWVRIKLDTTGKLIMYGAKNSNNSTPSLLYGDFDIEYWR